MTPLLEMAAFDWNLCSSLALSDFWLSNFFLGRRSGKVSISGIEVGSSDFPRRFTSNKGSVNYEHPHLELSLSADQVILLQKSVIATRPLQFAPSEVLLIVVFQTLC